MLSSVRGLTFKNSAASAMVRNGGAQALSGGSVVEVLDMEFLQVMTGRRIPTFGCWGKWRNQRSAKSPPLSQEISIAAHRQLESAVQVASHKVSQSCRSPFVFNLGPSVDHDRDLAVAGSGGAAVERNYGVAQFARLRRPDGIRWRFGRRS